MSIENRALPYAICLTAAGLVSALSASATTHYRFTQDGYSEGAFISGAFSGIDVNSDGRLYYATDLGSGETAYGELTDFSISFSGNSLVPAFSLSLKHFNSQQLYGLNVFSYELGGRWLGDDFSEGIEMLVQHLGVEYFYSTGLWVRNDPGGWVDYDVLDFSGPLSGADSSPNAARVTVVPEGGATLTLFALTFGGMLVGSSVVRRE
ncbi:MAG TPA: hypothetical protein PLX89_01735 [Verrucomicrobiota bacterium]|nr:hypothetical protein [Verrucomicrobiales bacterium]HRI11698.1 hypothetical protein [Verrucomicrobiota bacterium]